MFGRKVKNKIEKLSGPREIPPLVQNHLITEKKLEPDLAHIFRAVVRSNAAGPKAFHIRIFDESEATARKQPVKDYTSLDQYPELIIYDGWFDESTKQVELAAKKSPGAEVPLFTEVEIQKKLEGLDSGDVVFFFLARGPNWGGPLGRGAALVEHNPNYPGKRQKKFIIYTADVIDAQPVDKGQKVFDTDKARDVARWIKDVHHKRMY